MQLATILLLGVATVSTAAPPPVERTPSAWKHRANCLSVPENLTIHQYQLYPENLDYDRRSGLLYLGSLMNASVAIFDPCIGEVIDIIEFPGITHNPAFSVSGINIDERSGLLSIVASANAAFHTFGQDISGTNFIMQWDPYTRKLLYQINLTDTTQGKYGGFQDVEQDPDGNTYVVGSFPASILKVGKDRETITKWYAPTEPINTTVGGLFGLAAHGWILLGDDLSTGQIWRFDMREARGVPHPVPVTPKYTFGNCDAVYLPPKYKGTVLLMAEDTKGISVFRSKDGEWNSAEYLGLVPLLSNTTLVTAEVQIGDGIYMNIIPGTSGNESHFPLPDITRQVDLLLS